MKCNEDNYLNDKLGYAQLPAVPVGWAEKYNSFLSSIFGTTVRSYPKVFENYYWLKEEYTSVSKSQVDSIFNLLNGFNFNNNKKLLLESRRLNMCV